MTHSTEIPTVTEVIEDIDRDGLNFQVATLSDGNFKADAHYVDPFTGFRHYQGGSYFRTQEEAYNWVNRFTV